MQNGKVKDEIIEAFTEAGYVMSKPEVLTASDYGVPQIRRRVFFFGIKNELCSLPLSYPKATHKANDKNKLSRYVTVGDAISDLPENIVESIGIEVGKAVSYIFPAKNNYQKQMRKNSKSVYNHHTKRLLDTRMERISKLDEGATKISLPKELQAGGHENKYRRLSFSLPSPTLTAHMSKDLSDFIHPKHNRPITVREAARIQSFPDSYIFVGSEFQQLKQIGNAVPPLLGKAVAECIIGQLDLILANQRQQVINML
jgi:DNA (cytosine-5)-methyltransferase 1